MDASSSSITNSDYTNSSIGGFFGGPQSQVGMIVPTLSEEEQQGVRTNGEHLTSLPRSVRWRIQLGLLQDPTATTTTNTTTNNNNGNNDDKISCTLETVTEYNSEIIAKQGERFKELVEKHVEETEGVDATKNEQQQQQQPNNNVSSSSGNNNNNNNNATIDDTAKFAFDPLTAMVMEQEAQETRKAELYLKYRKERARRKRGLTTEARVIESENDEVVDRASVSYVLCYVMLCYVSYCTTICLWHT